MYYVHNVYNVSVQTCTHTDIIDYFTLNTCGHTDK